MLAMDTPLQWDDLLEYAREKYLDARLEHGDGLAWDTDDIWDVAAANGLMMSRDDMRAIALDSVPGELMLLLAEAEEYAKT